MHLFYLTCPALISIFLFVAYHAGKHTGGADETNGGAHPHLQQIGV